MLKQKFLSWLPTNSLEKRSPDPEGSATATGTTNSSMIDYYIKRTEVSYKRSEVYDDMDRMDDEIMARALDMETDDATQIDRRKRKAVWITASDRKKVEVLDKMFNRIQLEQRIWLWTRETNKYGDHFVRLSIDPDKGIMGVQDTQHPKKMVRLEKFGKLSGFLLLDPQSNPEMQPHYPHEWIHFRNLRYRIKDDLLPMDFYKKWDIDANARYGSPSLIKARRAEKQLRLAEDSLVLGRMAKSQYTQIHYVTVGDSGAKEQRNIVDNYEKLFTKEKNVDYNKDKMNSTFSPMAYADRVFVPVRSQQKGESRVQEVGGDLDITSIADIDMLNNKRFGAMGIPKEYMSFESNLGFNTLMQLDPRYARKITTYQQNMRIGLIQMCQIELFIHGLDPDPDQFSVHMTSVSTVNELERTDSLNALVDAGDRMVRFFQTVQSDIDMKYLYDYIINTQLQLPDIDVNRLFQDEGVEIPGSGGADFTTQERQEFVSRIEEAIEKDPEIRKLLSKFMQKHISEESSERSKQRIQGESLTEKELQAIKSKEEEKSSVLKKRTPGKK